MLGCGYVLLLIPPWRFALPGAGLDPSWVEVIAFGAREGWQWGRDVIFTYGPLGHLTPNPYPGARFGLQLALNAALALVLAAGVIALLPVRSLLAAIGLFVLIVFPVAMMGRSASSVLGMLAALHYFRRPDEPRHVLPLVMAGAAGVFALVNLSSSVVALSIFVLLDASRLARWRRPIHLPAFVAGVAFAYVGAGQSVLDLPQFLRSSFELIAGYASAMSQPGSLAELVVFLVVGLAALRLVAWNERSALSDPPRRFDAVLLIAVFAVYGIFALKAGFVRHDHLHSVNAWSMAAIAAAAYVAIRWVEPDARRACWSLAGLSVVCSFAAVSVQEQNTSLARGGRYIGSILFAQPTQALQQAALAWRDPETWAASWSAQRISAFAAIRAQIPLPKVEGTVDIIPNSQSSVLAHGMKYHPRPVFQDYAAYTPWLVERNRAHYRSTAAAQYVFLRPETIDGRYPLLDQSTGVSELLTYYDPLRLENNILVLKRRAEPLRALLVDAHEITAAFGQWVPLEAGAAPILLRAAVSPNLLGHLANIVLRPSILWLSVRFADGTVREFRLIEGIAKSGFLLSPLVEKPLDFVAVAIDLREAMEARRVVAFRIGDADFDHWLYHDAVRITYATLQLDSDAAHARGEALRPLFRRTALMGRVTASLRRPGDRMEQNAELAHPDMVHSRKGTIVIGPIQVEAQKNAPTNGRAS